MKTIKHKADFCVVGGGIAGLCAAVACARKGFKVVLMHDRPVLGGNASSEIRMWLSGANGENMLETGIIEEIQLENFYRNKYQNYSVWDSVLYGKAAFQDNLTLLLNCSCQNAIMRNSRIDSVKGWQLTTETFHLVKAELFADCSGDSILAPLAGAEFRQGREASNEFDESIAPEKADSKTMGMSCLIQARETESPHEYIPPDWAYKYTSDANLPNRGHTLGKYNNFWWLEIGGESDSIHGAEKNRDELLKTAFGVWDHIKNQGSHGAENWTLEWVGFLPGKRESRRYVGDHILTQKDVKSGGKFDDIIAYGGWPMDDHHPAGFKYPGTPTIFHDAPSPYGIPYRCLYSVNIENLLFAGRNISVTHAAMSSTRVMSTCGILGQATGTAASVALKFGITPRGVRKEKLEALQQILLEDDCFLPGLKRNISALTRKARLTVSEGGAEELRNGIDRPFEGKLNAWRAEIGSSVEFSFDNKVRISGLRAVFDSNLNRNIKNMPCYYPLEMENFTPPETLVADFDIEAKSPDGKIFTVAKVRGNYQRLIKVPFNIETNLVRVKLLRTRGAGKVNIFALGLF
jgi:hypothetical protein